MPINCSILNPAETIINVLGGHTSEEEAQRLGAIAAKGLLTSLEMLSTSDDHVFVGVEESENHGLGWYTITTKKDKDSPIENGDIVHFEPKKKKKEKKK